MYEAREQSEILTELQQNVGADVSSYEGTFTHDVLAANSIEFAKEEVELEQVYKVAFARSSWGDYLEMRAEEHGVFRRNAVRATGYVTVSGNGVVPLGSIFQTVTGIAFKTLKAITIAKSGDIPVECTIAGTIGNVAAETVTNIPMSIPGISSVINTSDITGGFDEEDDASLFNRLIFKVRQPVTSGNKNEYIQWATSVAGVGKVVVLPLWNGNGTVKVLITDVHGNPASSDLQSKVSSYIESVRPIGATVTVAAPTIFTVKVAIKPLDSENANPTAIQNVINDYFGSHQFDNIRITCALIGKMILEDSSCGVNDYESLTINGSTTMVTVTTDQIARCVEVTTNV
jgi:uncharacterized phage protein gp47/JayE